MTITFKPGNHPDADQLSAFIEQALPAHERDGVLAHLAVCPDCRAVVSLALPEMPAAAAAPERRRSSIFTGWMIFLPAAAAVAALAAFIFFVHRQAPAPQQQAEVTPAPVSAVPPQSQSGSAAQPKAATPAPNAEIARPAPPPADKRQVEAANPAVGSAGTMQPAASQPIANEPAVGQNAVNEKQSVESLPAQNAVESFAPTANNSVVSQNQPSQQASASRSTFHGGAINGAIQSNNNLQQNDTNTQNRPRLNGLQQTESQTVQVQAEAAPVATESAELSAAIAGKATSNLSFTRQPVPSGLPLLSSAAQGSIVLAIDTHHAVFVSNDSGQHWKTVRTAWKGRAVMVEAAAPARMLAHLESGADLESIAGLPQGAMLVNTAGVSLTGTVKDQSGAVVPGAMVTVIDPRSRLARTFTTDANGRYISAGLNPGNYDVNATAQGFMSNHLSNVAVAASQQNIANFTLHIGAAAETVTVEASEASGEAKAAPKLKTAPLKKQIVTPLFEIVTDKGAHWTSGDGITWEPK